MLHEDNTIYMPNGKGEINTLVIDIYNILKITIWEWQI